MVAGGGAAAAAVAAPPPEPEPEPEPDAAPAPPASAPEPAAGAPAAVAAPVADEQPAVGPPEPVAARAHNLAHELQAERLKTSGIAVVDAVAPAAAASDGGASPPTTEPVLIQRTRLDSMDRQQIDSRSDHARHARPGTATAVATTPAEPPVEPAAPEPESEPAAPVGERQATPAWLDTYDDEAEVTRDIDLSKTPPPKAASAVRDRTRTGDDIVPRH